MRRRGANTLTGRAKSLYDRAAMAASLILHVDPWQDSARGARYEGYLPADRLPRLSAVASIHAPVYVNISFHRQLGAAERGAFELKIEVRGRFDMICQRCLGPLPIESALMCSVWVVRDEAAARIMEPMGDAIVCPPGERLVLASLVEDELLLALPFAPSHSLSECLPHFDEDGHDGTSRVDEVLPTGEDGLEERRDEEEHRTCAGSGSDVTGRPKAAIKAAVHSEDFGPQAGSEGHCEVEDESARDAGKRNPFAVLARLRSNTDDQNQG